MAKKPSGTKDVASKEQLMKQLAAAPISTVFGVLDASGVSGGWFQGDRLWTMTFSFASWRIQGGPLHSTRLIVRREVREGGIEKYRELVKPNLVTKIRARVVEKSLWDRADALLVKVIGQDDFDPELKAEVARLQKPVKFKDSRFGVFTLDRNLNWFNAQVTWNGHRVRLALKASQPADVERTLRVARTLWRAQRTWKSKVLAHAAKELLPVKNANWLGDGERKVTSEKFKSRMKLESIKIAPDGSFEFWHEDGDLFFGHWIEVSGSLKKGMTNAAFHG